MKKHLSEAQIAAWISGEREPSLQHHLAACPACRAEIQKTEDALDAFRQSVIRWSERQHQLSAPSPSRSAPSGFALAWRKLSWGGLALGALALALLAVLPPRPGDDWLRLSAEDAALLETVQTEVSRVVPQPMDPLAKLVSWESAPDAPGLPAGMLQDSKD